MKVFDTLDDGLEWCEDELLAAFPDPAFAHFIYPAIPDLHAVLSSFIPERVLKHHNVDHVFKYFKQRHYARNAIIYDAGEKSTSIYMIAFGRVQVSLPEKSNNQVCFTHDCNLF
jgi:hypothetical protein